MLMMAYSAWGIILHKRETTECLQAPWVLNSSAISNVFIRQLILFDPGVFSSDDLNVDVLSCGCWHLNIHLNSQRNIRKLIPSNDSPLTEFKSISFLQFSDCRKNLSQKIKGTDLPNKLIPRYVQLSQQFPIISYKIKLSCQTIKS